MDALYFIKIFSAKCKRPPQDWSQCQCPSPPSISLRRRWWSRSRAPRRPSRRSAPSSSPSSALQVRTKKASMEYTECCIVAKHVMLLIQLGFIGSNYLANYEGSALREWDLTHLSSREIKKECITMSDFIPQITCEFPIWHTVVPTRSRTCLPNCEIKVQWSSHPPDKTKNWREPHALL